MLKHNSHPQEDAITDHTGDSSGTEEVDITQYQYQDQDASHTAFEHAPSLLLLASSRTPPHPSEPSSSSPAPSQLPLTKAPRRYQKAPRHKAVPGQAKTKPVTQKRALTKRKAKESVRTTKRQKKKVRFVNPNDGDDGDDDDNDTDDALEPYVDPEMPTQMPMQMPLHHMMPPHLPPFHPDTTAYHHSMTYHGVASARDMLFLQYQVAAREAFDRNEQWGHLWNQSSLMEQRAASVLVEFKFLTPLVPLVPLVVSSSAGVLYPPQLHPHRYLNGNPECYYEA
ncbi:hypothetical protein CPB97_005421 [Podila verticillata]|nr:hypothetical protein CPB97_005421 [Podila verticillata]